VIKSEKTENGNGDHATNSSFSHLFRFPIQSAMFHPYRPFMLICTRTCVYLYDLNEQSLIKKLSSGNQTLSCMAVHPGGNLLSISFDACTCVLLDPSTFHTTGDNLIIGTDLGRLAWYDSGNETMHLPLHHLSFTFDD